MYEINPVLHGFSMEPVREGHAHVCFAKPIKETEEAFRNILQHFNYASLNINAVPVGYSMTENYQALYCKSKLAPRVFASAGLEYYLDERDTPEYFLSQIRAYHAMGFDGMKMLDGKVTQYRLTKRKLNEPIFDKFYAYAEENRIPIVMHIGDPAKFWDPDKITPYARERGWFYNETEPTLEEVRGWVEDVLSRFPKLHLVLAHFYFMSYEMERLAKLLDTYENVCVDLTPGGEMFVGFTDNYDEACSFFKKYQDRILYGTDMYNTFENVEKAESEIAGPRVFQLRSFLEKKEDFMAPTLSDKPLHPFGFEGDILDKIYRKNSIRLYGETPRALDVEKILSACEKVYEKAELNDLELENMEHIIKYFKSL